MPLCKKENQTFTLLTQLLFDYFFLSLASFNDVLLPEEMRRFTCPRLSGTAALEEDAQILKVIEAYCTSAKTRQTLNSSEITHIHTDTHAR